MIEDIHPKLVVHSSPESIEAEKFKELRAQVLFPKDGKKKKIILATSIFPGEGKTFVAVNLAASIAMSMNEHVLLVDCDFRRPALHKMFSYPNRAGLHDFLENRMELSELIIRTKIEKLSFLPAGRPTKKPAELLSSAEMSAFLNEVKERYDDRYIILDSAPMYITSEVNVLTKYVDGVIFVILNGRTPRETVKKHLQKIGKENLIGVVFNGYDQNFKQYNKFYRNQYK